MQNINSIDLQIKFKGNEETILKKEKLLNILNKILEENKIYLSNYNFIKPQYAVDLAIIINDSGEFKIPLIERKFSLKGFALPGGFIDEGETQKEAAIRELYEEVNVEVSEESVKEIGYIKGVDSKNIFRNYTQRDPRGGDISTTLHIAELNKEQSQKAIKTLKSGDDAESVKLFSFKEIISMLEKQEFAQGHEELIMKTLFNSEVYLKKIMEIHSDKNYNGDLKKNLIKYFSENKINMSSNNEIILE